MKKLKESPNLKEYLGLTDLMRMSAICDLTAKENPPILGEYAENIDAKIQAYFKAFDEVTKYNNEILKD